MAEDNTNKILNATYVFLDTNILLEGKPLVDLPWAELKVDGPIVAIFVPRVLTEVDSRKRDGRLGIRAREFNRLMRPVAVSSEPVRLFNCTSEVYLTIAQCGKLDWSKFPDMEQDDADSRIIVEILHARGIPLEKKQLVSNDVKPVWLASQNGLQAIHASDAWLRPKEPSPHDKEVQKLKQRVAELEKQEPALDAEIEIDTKDHISYAVHPLSPSEQHDLVKSILARKPRPHAQRRGLHEFALPAWTESRVTEESYQQFESKAVPDFVAKFPDLVEWALGQVPVNIRIRNSGPLRAENLIVKVSISSGWINADPIWIPLRGPSPKVTRALYDQSHLMNFREIGAQVGRHDMDFVVKPKMGKQMEVHCQDFTCQTEWVFQGVLFLDPHTDGVTHISLRMTAANMHGSVEKKIMVTHQPVPVKASDVVDVLTGHPTVSSRVQELIKERLQAEDFNAVEIYKLDES